MRLSIEGMEKERDFYFGKLRDIEVVVQEYSDTDDAFASKILDVLYATEVGKNVLVNQDSKEISNFRMVSLFLTMKMLLSLKTMIFEIELFLIQTKYYRV